MFVFFVLTRNAYIVKELGMKDFNKLDSPHPEVDKMKKIHVDESIMH